MMDMSFKVTYLPGKANKADALSRVPMWRESGVHDPAENVFQVRRTPYRRWHGKHFVNGKIWSVSALLNYTKEDIQLDKMFKVGEKDKQYNMVMDKMREGASQKDIVKLPKNQWCVGPADNSKKAAHNHGTG